MKVGDVIKYGGIWGVVSKIEGSRAHFRIQEFIPLEPLSIYSYTEHCRNYIDLVDYYKWNDPNFVQRTKYKIYGFLKDFWEIITYDGDSFFGGIVLLFLLSILSILVGSSLAIIFMGV